MSVENEKINGIANEKLFARFKQKADLLVLFEKEYGRLPRTQEVYMDERIGSFLRNCRKRETTGVLKQDYAGYLDKILPHWREVQRITDEDVLRERSKNETSIFDMGGEVPKSKITALIKVGKVSLLEALEQNEVELLPKEKVQMLKYLIPEKEASFYGVIYMGLYAGLSTNYPKLINGDLTEYAQLKEVTDSILESFTDEKKEMLLTFYTGMTTLQEVADQYGVSRQLVSSYQQNFNEKLRERLLS